jgi:hypothetical protein
MTATASVGAADIADTAGDITVTTASAGVAADTGGTGAEEVADNRRDWTTNMTSTGGRDQFSLSRIFIGIGQLRAPTPAADFRTRICARAIDRGLILTTTQES